MALPRQRLSDILAPDTSMPGADPTGAGVLPPGQDTSALSDQQLGQLGDAAPVGQDIDPEALQVQELTQALQDPNTPPQVKAQIQAELAMAARRKLAGVGAPPQLPSY